MTIIFAMTACVCVSFDPHSFEVSCVFEHFTAAEGYWDESCEDKPAIEIACCQLTIDLSRVNEIFFSWEKSL